MIVNQSEWGRSLATLSVWRFEDPEAADRSERRLIDFSKGELITVLDAATVAWPPDAKKPRTRHLANLTGAGVSWGALWGLLFGLLFFMPLIGAAAGAVFGGVAGHFAHVGIEADFIERVGKEVAPGTSALFLLSEDEVAERVRDAFADGELVSTGLSPDQAARLREAFAD